jgi:4-oxalocrotonate tautomerase
VIGSPRCAYAPAHGQTVVDRATWTRAPATPSRRNNTMPEVYIHAIEGRSKEQKRALIKDITEAVVKNFGVGADAVLVEIIETSRDNKAKGGVLFSER